MPAYFVVLGHLFFVAVVARIFRNVAAALEISVVGAKHRASWRNRFLACLVPRGRGSILSRATFSFALSLRRPRAAIVVPCLIVFGGIGLRAFLAAQNPSVDGGGVSFRGFQAWIYYPTWTRLDPLVFGVVLAAIEKFRPNWWQRLINCAPWLWLPALGLIAYALYLGETENLTVAACVWQFPLIAVGMAALLVCAVSPRLPLCRVAIPGAAFIASIAYSAYLIQKLVINGVEQFCTNHNIDLTSAPALLGVELCVYIAATTLFFLSRTAVFASVEVLRLRSTWFARIARSLGCGV